MRFLRASATSACWSSSSGTFASHSLFGQNATVLGLAVKVGQQHDSPPYRWRSGWLQHASRQQGYCPPLPKSQPRSDCATISPRSAQACGPMIASGLAAANPNFLSRHNTPPTFAPRRTGPSSTPPKTGCPFKPTMPRILLTAPPKRSSQGHSVLLPLTASMAAWRCSAKCSIPSTGLKPRRRRSVSFALRKAASTCGACPALVRA